MEEVFLAGVVWPPNEDMREEEVWEDRAAARPERAFRSLGAARSAVEAEMQDAIEQGELPDPGLEWSLQEGLAIEEWRCDLAVPYGPDPDATRPFGWVRRIITEG